MADLGGSQDGVPDCFCDEFAQVVDGLRSVVLAGFEFGGEEAGQGVAAVFDRCEEGLVGEGADEVEE